MKSRILFLLALCFAMDSFAAKKDFKGLFGSYRREKFTENEGRDTDFGMDIMLSTLLPVTTIASSSETRGVLGSSMSYATFFNLEAGFFFTLAYNWEVYFNISYYTYDTRQKNATATATPQFHLFEMEAIPMLVGLKYRFGRTDIVPYIGFGAGMVYVHRKAYYDYNDVTFKDTYSNGLAAQGTLGVEFYIAPRTGIRLEMSAMYLGMKQDQFDTGAVPANFPIMDFHSNPIAVRYSSGLFILF